MLKKEYKAIIEDNPYITFDLVTEFLRNAMIADLECVSKIYNNGLSITSYYNLQEALDELEIF